jgi:putative oxidoreductase
MRRELYTHKRLVGGGISCWNRKIETTLQTKISTQGNVMQASAIYNTNGQASSAATAYKDEVGKLILRVVLALLLLFHGVSKLTGGNDSVTGALLKAGLPAFLNYGVYIGEVIAPAMILLGIWSRAAALVVAINMIVAVLLVHTSQFFTLSKTGGWALELQALYFIAAIVVAIMGAGRYSMGGALSKWN